MTERGCSRRRNRRGLRSLALLMLATALTVSGVAAAEVGAASTGGAAAHSAATGPSFGPNVLLFDPSMPQWPTSRPNVDAIAAQQVGNEMGSARYALLFKPGTYGTAADPLNFQVGYYTEVAGLGPQPGRRRHQRLGLRVQPVRRAERLHRAEQLLAVAVQPHDQRDQPRLRLLHRRVLGRVAGGTDAPGARQRPDHADGLLHAARRSPVAASSPTRGSTGPSSTGRSSSSSSATARSNGWTQRRLEPGVRRHRRRAGRVLPGRPTVRRPVHHRGHDPGEPGEALPLRRRRRAPTSVFVPGGRDELQRGDLGRRADAGPLDPARRLLRRQAVATRSQAINRELARGRNLLLTPGVYDVDRTIKVKRGRHRRARPRPRHASPRPPGRRVPITVADVPGVDIAGVTFDAGPVNSPVLLQVGTQHANGRAEQAGWSSAADPTALQDVFFRIGGPHAGKATVSLEVNSDHVILDDIWAWRADHGNGVGWTRQHRRHRPRRQRRRRHRDRPLRRALPEVPGHLERRARQRSSSSRTSCPTTRRARPPGCRRPATTGYAGLLVGRRRCERFTGDRHGHATASSTRASTSSPTTPSRCRRRRACSLHDLLTIFLDPTNGKGGIRHVVNDIGGSSTIANPDVPVTVVDYP